MPTAPSPLSQQAMIVFESERARGSPIHEAVQAVWLDGVLHGVVKLSAETAAPVYWRLPAVRLASAPLLLAVPVWAAVFVLAAWW